MLLENNINNLRKKLKAENIKSVNEQEYDYSVGTLYIDIVSEMERLGDYVVNVVQARFGKKYE